MSLTVVQEPQAPRAAPRAVWSLHGHDDEVLSACAHKNLFATCGVDGVALVWQLSPEERKGPLNVCRIVTRGPAMLDACFVDDRRLATAQGDATVAVWSVETGQQVVSVSRSKVAGRTSWPVVNAVTTTSRDSLCFGGDEGYVVFVDTRSLTVTSSMNLKVPITSLTAAADGSLFSGDVAGHVRGFEPRMSWRKFMDTKCAAAGVASVTCGAKGDLAAVYTMDGNASLVDTQPFAMNQQERLLASTTLGYGEDKTLRRGDWSDVLDTVVFPDAQSGGVACMNPSRFSAGVARTLHPPHEGGDEETPAPVYFATLLQDRYVLFGGSSSLCLHEL